MFSRKGNEKSVSPLSGEWLETLQDSFAESFQHKYDTENKFFQLFTFAFDDELVTIISLGHLLNVESPISCFVSTDVGEKDDQKKRLDLHLQLSSNIFEEILDDPNWDDYSPRWLETKFNQADCYYKISRENIPLTIEANRMLDEDGKNSDLQ